MLIAGDIGGTKTLVGLYEPDSDGRNPVVEHEFHSAAYKGLEDITAEFVAKTGRKVTGACFDVAGPVRDGRAKITNLPWTIDERVLGASLGLDRVVLLNDLKAIAYAVPHLNPDEMHTINAGAPEEHGAIAVIAPGTGLGEAYLVWGEDGYIACSSEGGHSDFAPTDETQAALWAFLVQRFGHVAYERVCSGSGLPNIYDFFRDRDPGQESPDFAAKLAAAADRTPLIVQAALEAPGDHPLCRSTLETFVAILGAEAGNLALKFLATAGVYLAGGIPPRLLPQLTDGRFMTAFTGKGRFHDLLSAVPVHVVTARAAMLGAVLYGLDAMRSH